MLQLAHEQPCAPHYQGCMPILDMANPFTMRPGRSHYAVHALRTSGPVREAGCAQSRGLYSYGPFAQVTLYGMQGAERVAQRHRLGQVCIALILNDFR